LAFLGRLGNMLKGVGENVSPTEVGGHLSTRPAVRVVQVVAAPDAHYGQVPAAYLMLDEGVDATADEPIDFCLRAIATYQVPRYVCFVQEWPMPGTRSRSASCATACAPSCGDGISRRSRGSSQAAYGEDQEPDSIRARVRPAET
jgi:acyl-CoA synthetase (AMP-forming)/AMP-acid ligase II